MRFPSSLAVAALLFTLAPSAHAAWTWLGGAGPSAWESAASWDKGTNTGLWPGHTAGDDPFQDSLNGTVGHAVVSSAIPEVLPPWSNMGLHSGSDFTVEVASGGSLAINNIWFGRNGGTGHLIVDGGSFFNTSGGLIIGDSGSSDTTGTISVLNGGTVTTNSLSLGNSRTTNSALVTINDGSITATGLSIFDPGALQNITFTGVNGVLNLNGDKTGDVTTWIGNGGIVDGTGNGLSNTYDSNSNMTIVTPIPEPTSMSLLALGGLAMLRRRRRA